MPTLLLSGAFDPITPPAWAESTAASLFNAYNFVIPGVGHSPVDASICAQEIATAFINDPNAAPNANCIGGLEPVEFYTP